MKYQYKQVIKYIQTRKDGVYAGDRDFVNWFVKNSYRPQIIGLNQYKELAQKRLSSLLSMMFREGHLLRSRVSTCRPWQFKYTTQKEV